MTKCSLKASFNYRKQAITLEEQGNYKIKLHSQKSKQRKKHNTKKENYQITIETTTKKQEEHKSKGKQMLKWHKRGYVSRITLMSMA